MKPYIVGICGGSASGKTFLLKQLLAQLPSEKVSLISQDNYYKEKEAQYIEADGLVNYDHPDSLDLQRFATDIQALVDGRSIAVKEYTFNHPTRVPRIFQYKPTPLIVVEGLFIFHLPQLAALIDLKVFIEAEEHIKLLRRLKRDVRERNYSFEETLRDYERFVAPMYKKYVEPTKSHCDLVIHNNSHTYKAIPVLVHHLQAVVAERERGS